MCNRVAALLGLSLLLVAGFIAVTERNSVAQTPPAAGEPAAPSPPAASPPAEAAPAPVVTAPPAAVMPPVTTAPPAVTIPPVVTAPPSADVPPAVTAPAAATPAPVVTAPPPQAPAPVVTAPPAMTPEPVVAVPAPLPPTKPAIAEDKMPAKALFSAQQLPTLGHAMAIGYYPRGCLQGGVELPVNGPTWQVMRLSRNRNWGHPSLVHFLEKFAPLAAKATGWHGILVGDMAQPRGGPLPFGHLSHQIGLDVDIWFMPMPGHLLSKDERENTSAINLVADDWTHVNPKTWSPSDIAFIKTAAEQPDVERVLVNAAIKKEMCRVEANHSGWMAKVRPWYGHHDHIHVRLKCPADSPNCRKQPPVPGDDGCGKSLDYWFSDKVLHPKPKVGGKPPRPLMLTDLPPACKNVLDAPARQMSKASERQ
jgi:penicillin-insensitive murein endopeptidase